MSTPNGSHGDHDTTDEAPWLRMTIHPEPGGDEGEALISAISAYLALHRNAAAEALPPAPPASRWQTAGRRTAIRGIAKSPRMGWGREGAGWS